MYAGFQLLLALLYEQMGPLTHGNTHTHPPVNCRFWWCRSRYHFQQALATRTGNPGLGGSAAPDTSSIGQDTGVGEMTTSRAVETPRGAACAEVEGTAHSRTPPAPVPQRTLEKSGSVAAPASERLTRKLHLCPHPGCSKEYKQLSGLRYHLTHVRPPSRLLFAWGLLHCGADISVGLTRQCVTHVQGHADALPLQLDIVPPTLARMVAKKERSTRR